MLGLGLGLGLTKAGQGGEVELSDLDFIYAAFEFNDTTVNSAAPLTYDFDPADVDTGADTIDFGSDIGFGAWQSLGSGPYGLPVTFETTGTLPAGLEQDKEYFIAKSTGTEFLIYPKITENPATRLPYTTPDENIYESQAFVLGENNIDLTDQGTGTHTMRTVKTAQYFYDMVDGYKHAPLDEGDHNSWIELRDDEYGTYRPSRIKARDSSTANYAQFGSVYTLEGDGTQIAALIAAVANKRTIVRSIVGRFPEHYNYGNPKTTLTMPDEVNTGANTLALGGINTGDVFRIIANGSATLPSPLAEDTDYYYNNTNDTVHTNLTDAEAGTNPIDITTTGSGDATVYATQRVGDGNRHAFLSEVTGLDTDGGTDNNMLTVATENNFDTVKGIIPYDSGSYLSISGSTNGRFLTFGASKLSRVSIWFPAGAVPPTRLDTGQPLAAGIYYVGGGTGSCRQALYDNEADAIADAALNLDVAASTTAIKYSARGEGEFQIKYEDEGIMFKYSLDRDSGTGVRPAKKLPKGVHHHVWVADRNDPAESVAVIDYYVDGVFQWRMETNEEKGDTGNLTGGGVNHFILNSIAAHATGVVDVYADYYGSSTGVVEQAEVTDFYNYVNARFTLDGTLARARNTVLPSITGTEVVGETLTINDGTWTGTPTPTLTYQWYRDGSAISGATSSTYTLVEADEGAVIHAVVTGDNSLQLSNAATTAETGTIAAAATAPSNDVLPAISGTETEGEELTCSTGTWSGTPTITYAYQWERSGTPISGATSSTYTLVIADVGQTLTCVVTATNSEGSVSAESSPTGTITIPSAGGSTMDEIVASAVFDIDMTYSASYVGTGTTVSNLVASPADGASQTDYDFTINGTLDFQGTAGDGGAYLQADNTTYLQILANTTFLNDLHKEPSGQIHTFAIAWQLSGTTGDQTVFATQNNASSDAGIRHYINSSNSVRYRQGSGSANINAFGGVLPSSQINIFIVSYNPNTGAVKIWENSDTATTDTTISNVSGTNTPALFTIFARGNGGETVNNGARFKGMSAFNEFFDDTKAAAVRAEYITRYGL